MNIWLDRKESIKRLMEALGLEPEEGILALDFSKERGGTGETEDSLAVHSSFMKFIHIGFPKGDRRYVTDVLLTLPNPLKSNIASGQWYECNEKQTEQLVILFAMAVNAIPRCDKCNDTGIIKTGNNDLPCDCPAGATAWFNVVDVEGKVTGAEMQRHFLNGSPEPIVSGKDLILADNLPGRQ